MINLHAWLYACMCVHACSSCLQREPAAIKRINSELNFKTNLITAIHACTIKFVDYTRVVFADRDYICDQNQLMRAYSFIFRSIKLDLSSHALASCFILFYSWGIIKLSMDRGRIKLGLFQFQTISRPYKNRFLHGRYEINESCYHAV